MTAVRVFAAWVVLPTILGTVAFGVATYKLAGAAAGVDVGVGRALRLVRDRMSAFLMAGLMAGLVSTLLVITFGNLWVMLETMLWGPPFLLQALVFEEKRAGPAWKRAKQHLAGQWGRVVLALVCIALGVGFLILAIPNAALIAVQSAPRATELVVYGAIATIFGALVVPFLAAVELVLYGDLRARKEELDAEGFRQEVSRAIQD